MTDIKFELNRLPEYTDEAIFAELRRVAVIVGDAKLTTPLFNKYSKVHSSTVGNHFGSWLNALYLAGLSDKADDRVQNISKMTKEEFIELIRNVALKLQQEDLTANEFYEETGITRKAIKRRFVLWENALKEAGLKQRKGGIRYSDEECFENILKVWIHYGRPPTNTEMKLSPSTIGLKAYMRWKTWNKALSAFVDWINREEKEAVSGETKSTTSSPELIENKQNIKRRSQREPTPRQKVLVWVRDKHKCQYCGRSPAKDPEIVLHVDHIFPWDKGGETVIENLQTLCSKCNLGKGDLEL